MGDQIRVEIWCDVFSFFTIKEKPERKMTVSFYVNEFSAASQAF